jgi:predicted RND superfamily exporter protein
MSLFGEWSVRSVDHADQTVSMDNSDTLPEGIEVIEAFDILEDNFGTSATAMIAIEINPEYQDSDEPRDIRDPDVIEYVALLTDIVKSLEHVADVTSASTSLELLNGGFLPRSKREIIELTSKNYLMSQYISEDHEMTLIKIDLADDYDISELADETQKAISQISKPVGVVINLAGDSFADPVMEQELGPDMGRTSQFSLLGIVVILWLLFRSPRYSFTPLLVIGLGVMWTFGYLGLIGTNINSATSGVISMIMGIGIDFGIQMITRYKAEKLIFESKKALVNTLNAVFVPMATTTLSALIGFKAMSMGQLTIMAEFGNIMSYGITACFIAALTVIPAILMISEKYFPEKKKTRTENNKRKRKFKSFPRIIGDMFNTLF